MSTFLDTEHSPVGRGDGSDPAAEAQHSADIADMMASRAEAHAGRADESAAAAKDWATIAQNYSQATSLTLERTAFDSRRAATASARGSAGSGKPQHLAGMARMLVLGVFVGFALSILGYVAVVRIVHDTIGTTQGPVVYDTHPAPPETLMPNDKDAGPGHDVITPGRDSQPYPR
jgi:hypothetical protein